MAAVYQDPFFVVQSTRLDQFAGVLENVQNVLAEVFVVFEVDTFDVVGCVGLV